jgi:hypothetical protein
LILVSILALPDLQRHFISNMSPFQAAPSSSQMKAGFSITYGKEEAD